MRRKTEEEKAWLMENAPLHSHAETLDLFEQRFGWRISRASFANWMHSNGLVSSTRAGYVKWDEEKDAYFREIVPGHSESEIRELFEERFGVRLRKTQIKAHKADLGVKSGTVGGRFDSSSGGFKSEEHRRKFIECGVASRFKRGNLPHNAVDVPLGTERVNFDGYVEVKIAERKSRPNSNDNWKAKHRIVWEQANGRPVPEGHVIAFMDRDKQNFDPANLACVSRSEWSALNKLGYYDKESFEAALTTARLTAKIGEIEKRDRPCGRCGETFRPRFARQRTCDACLERG